MQKLVNLLSSMIYFFQDSAYAVDYTVQVPLNIAKLRAVSQENFVLSDNSIEDQTKNNKPRLNWGKVLSIFEKDMITEFSQIVLNGSSVKAEIDMTEAKKYTRILDNFQMSH